MQHKILIKRAYPKYATTFRIRKDSSFDRENINILAPYQYCDKNNKTTRINREYVIIIDIIIPEKL